MLKTTYLKPLMLMLTAAGLMMAGTTFAAEHGGEPVDSSQPDHSSQSAEHPGDSASHHDKNSDKSEDKSENDKKDKKSQEHPGH